MADIKLQEGFLDELSELKAVAADMKVDLSLKEGACTPTTEKFKALCDRLVAEIAEYQKLLQQDVAELEKFYNDMRALDRSK